MPCSQSSSENPYPSTRVYYTRHPRFIVLAINTVMISQKGNEVKC